PAVVSQPRCSAALSSTARHGTACCLAKAPRPQPAQGLSHPISVAGAGAWVLIKHNPKATSHR
uniref:Uncharacterized protein n=1 Tax=Anser brachyrhynchus TaxID=132585 RepID=A0A8B9ICK2_9AVES